MKTRAPLAAFLVASGVTSRAAAQDPAGPGPEQVFEVMQMRTGPGRGDFGPPQRW